MSKTTKRSDVGSGWLPVTPKQIALAIAALAAVGAAIAFIWRYQASQPKPLPESVYADMYKSMYGRPANAPAGEPGSTPSASPPGPPGGSAPPQSPAKR